MRTRLALFALAVTAPLAFGQTPETRPGATVVLQLVSLSDEGFAKFALDYPAFAVKGAPVKAPQSFTVAELTKLIAAVTSDRQAHVLQAPRLTLDDGQTSTLAVGQKEVFTTAYEPKEIGGKTVDVPKTEETFLGLTATMTPVVSADRSRVSLRIDLTHKTVEPNVPLFPITKLVTPVFEGGSQGVPVPFTQFVQRPVFHELKAETTASLASGSGVAVYVGKQPMQSHRQSDGPPVLSKVPYVNRLFKNQGIGFEPRHLILIATATVTEVPVAQGLVADYRKAIAEGRKDDALAAAMKALAADPACFAK